MQEQANGASLMNIGAESAMRDKMALRGHILIDKYDEHGNYVDSVEADNLFLTAGINEIFKLISGQSTNTFTTAGTTIGIGDSTTAAAAGQTDLQAATNKTYVALTAGYPTVPSAGSMQFQASFGSAVANYVWSEFVIKQATSLICIDRGVGTFGTKASGSTWVATVTLSMA